MDYIALYKYYYNNRKKYETFYLSRFQNELTVHFDFKVNGSSCFFLPHMQMIHLLTEIYSKAKELEKLKQTLPEIALHQFTLSCLIDEIKLTNEIEGVHSTRKEINDIINSNHTPQKNKRLYGLVQKYCVLSDRTELTIKNCSDIRNIFDDLVSEEIDIENPEELPDGLFFRKDSVSVQNEHMKVIHKGLIPEETIITTMDQALEILNDTSLNLLIRISIFHYLFGYIHPFYNGNGRVSRFISSYLLSKHLDPLISYNLSYTIKKEITKYYKAFEITNNKINRGDLTPFILIFLEIIYDSIKGLYENLEERAEQLSYYQTIIKKHFHDDETSEMLIYVLTQNALFGTEPVSAKDLSSIVHKSYATVNNRLKKLRPFLRQEFSHRYDADLDALSALDCEKSYTKCNK